MRLTRDATSVPTHGLHRRVSRGWASATVIVALGLVFVLDRGTDAAPFQHLYYLPIVFASVQLGYAGSLAIASAAVGLYHVANPHLMTLRYEEHDIVQVALFFAVGLASAKFAGDARRLQRLATTDDLTGLRNLRAFESELRLLVGAAWRARAPLAMLVLDVDRLKSLNDVHGHLTGAEAVRTVGKLIAEGLPRGAAACRYGGDEFVIALPQCTESEAAAFADSLRRAVHETAPTLDGVAFPSGTLSISIGIACRRMEPARSEDVQRARDLAGEQLFRAADTALYAAKRAGRNRISIGDAAA